MDYDKFADNIESIRLKLYKTAFMYFQNETTALDVLDETVYKALKGYKKLKQKELFDTWITRILINECHREYKRKSRFTVIEEFSEESTQKYDALPLKEAIKQLPEELKTIIILRYFSDYTLKETAEALQLPLGTVSTRQRKALALLKIELGEEDIK